MQSYQALVIYQKQMTKMPKSNEESKGTLVISEKIVGMEDVGLLLRLYEMIRMNRKVKSGFEHLEKLSAPIREKYHIYVDENLDKVKTKLAYWVSGVNIYNHLTGLWLYQNMPFVGNPVELIAFIQSFEALGKVKNEEKVNDLIKSFYQITSDMWNTLKNPSNEEIRNTLLESVAKTINRNYNFENENFANGLLQMFKTLIETTKEFITEENYIAKVRHHIGDQIWKKDEFDYVQACKEYYTFAKRFVLIDSPPCQNTNVKKWMINYIKDKTYDCSENIIETFEKNVDKLIKYFDISHEPFNQTVSLSKRAERILLKIRVIGVHLYNIGTSKVKSSKLYITADGYIGFDQRIDTLLALLRKAYTEVNLKAIKPTYEYIKINEKLVKDKLEVVFQNINVEVLKSNYNNLYKKYAFLKSCLVVVKNDVLTLVFERNALKKFGEELRQELINIYYDIKLLEKARIRSLGNDLYKRALQKIQSIEARAIENKPTIEEKRE